MEEQKSDNNHASLSIARKIPVADKNTPPPPEVATAKKKRRGAMQLIKVALFMLRRRSGKANSVNVVASRGMWNRLVGSIRPLHLQNNGSPRQNSSHNPKNSIIPEVQDQRNDDVISNITSILQQPMSPAASSSYSSSASSGHDGMSSYASVGNLQDLESRYTSAVNLRDLDSSCEEEEEERECGYRYDENGGDEMIDVKAEEFIAQFYEQMRLQRLNSIDRRYNEMIERSIG
ncbi:hypothetical protein L484_007455 [Morus notabilis]|uniref:DUF761 domain-containing protein n=1 Tax=Morus notabilis TaxID=981085 RepID=W9RL15_9ROSA|nr:uncharacterized protein LOC21390853 [Morus notabilis]EXB95705.1 hypothetical protein L484_007455 [Morus notabilis]